MLLMLHGFRDGLSLMGKHKLLREGKLQEERTMAPSDRWQSGMRGKSAKTLSHVALLPASSD